MLIINARWANRLLTTYLLLMTFAALRADDTSWTLLPTDLPDARRNHTSLVLSDGKVLVAGGVSQSAVLSSCVLYDPRRGTWSSAASMIQARCNHTMVMLSNGRVMVIGGTAQSPHASCEIYNPLTNSWSAAGSLNAARYAHTTTTFFDGVVIAIGGLANGQAVAACERYYPDEDEWRPDGSLTTARYSHTATYTTSAEIVVAGGNVILGNGSSVTTASIEIYNPGTGQWRVAASSLATSRSNHTATLLHSGKLFFAGGQNIVAGGGSSYVESCETFDVATETRNTVANPLTPGRYLHTATLLPSGVVMIVGGASATFPTQTQIFDPWMETWSQPSAILNTGRYAHTATLLPSAEVLVVGGANDNVLASSELGHFVTGVSYDCGLANGAERNLTLTQLLSGRILAFGGLNANGTARRECALFDTAANLWSATGLLRVARESAAGAMLRTGSILAAGGLSDSQPLTSCELYDPLTGQWTLTGSLGFSRRSITAAVLPSGSMLVTGGEPLSEAAIACEIYNIGTGTWVRTGNLTGGREGHTLTMLKSGRILAAGGYGSLGAMSSCEIYNPQTGTWSGTGSMNVARLQHTATLLPSGEVLVAGGNYSGAMNLCEIYNPDTGTWTTTTPMQIPRFLHKATLLPTGEVLVTSGQSTSVVDGYTEVYQPALRSWRTYQMPGLSRIGHDIALLPNGFVLVASGATIAPRSYCQAVNPHADWMFTPDPDLRRPDITSAPTSLYYSQSLTVSGNKFMSSCEASTGVTSNSRSGYPLLQIQSLQSGQQVWLPQDPTKNFGVQTISGLGSLGVASGPAAVRVFVNGRSSDAVNVMVLQENVLLGWAVPSPIVYGTALSATQLNVSPPLPGTIQYFPASGTVLDAGSRSLYANYYPTDGLGYAVATASTILTVTPKTASVTAGSVSRVYGATNPAFTVTTSGFLGGDSISASASSTATANTPVGVYGSASPYAITPTLSDPNSRLANYAVTPVKGTLTITAATLLLQAADATMTEGDPLPVFSVSGTGFIAPDTLADLDTQPVVTTTATSASAPGTYTLMVSGASDANYRITYATGTLTVLARPAAPTNASSSSNNCGVGSGFAALVLALGLLLGVQVRRGRGPN